MNNKQNEIANGPTPKLTNKRKVGRPKISSKNNSKQKSTGIGTNNKTPKKPNTQKNLNKIPSYMSKIMPPTTPTNLKTTIHQNKTTPITNNSNKRNGGHINSKITNKVHDKVDQDATVKTSEKPPEDEATVKSVLIENIDTPMMDRLTKSTFLIQKELNETKNIPDDDSTVENANSTLSEFPNSVRTTMMYKLPPKTGDITEEDCPLLSIKKMNQMIKALTNKLACRLGPWKLKDTKTQLKASDLITELPEDIDFAETYVYDFNRFLSFGKNGYVRLQFYYSDTTSLPEIEQVISQFKIPRVQFLEKAHSDAISPTTIGTLTGSVEEMAYSRDFKEIFMHKFSLSTLGLWWGIPRQKKGEYNSNKAVIHIEIDQKDYTKRKNIEKFFNSNSTGIDNHFLGVPMLLTPPFNYFANDEVKATLETHSRKQVSLSKAISYTTISGIGLSNWANGDKTSTLLRELMSVESITKKKIMKGKKSSTFLGRLFYAIIPNRANKTVTFYFTKANALEGRGVARGLPHFLRDYFHLDPAFFCNSTALTEAMEGDWTLTTRKFLSAQEKMENDRLDDMEEEANAIPEPFISKDHQQALAIDDDEVSIETRLTKGDEAPTPAIEIKNTTDDQSDMTGSTRESKSKRYAEAAVKKVINEYSGTILNMKSDLDAKEDRIEQLEMMLKNLNSVEMEGTEEHPIMMHKGTTNEQSDDDSEDSNSNISYSSSVHSDTNNINTSSELTNKNIEDKCKHSRPTRSSTRDKRKLLEDDTRYDDNPDLHCNHTISTRSSTREKRKISKDDISYDNTSRSTRYKSNSSTDITIKPPSSDGAVSL